MGRTGKLIEPIITGSVQTVRKLLTLVVIYMLSFSVEDVKIIRLFSAKCSCFPLFM